MSGRRSSLSGRDRWLLSYADVMTLLFACFATMYAISSVDARKLTGAARALPAAFDDPARTSRPLPRPAVPEAVARELAADIRAGRIDVSVDPRGVVLSIPESVIFATGSDELSPAAQAFFARIAATLAQVPNAVRVEGHTDDVPIHTARFRSNWELSTARATRVIEFLTGSGGLDGRRLSAAGYAEFRPHAANASPDDRARNRRVDLVIAE